VDRRSLLQGAALAVGGLFLGGGATEAYAEERPNGDANFASRHTNDAALGALRVVWRVPTKERLVALTFDDGPTTEYTGEVLRILAAHDVTATFNLVGSRVAARPALARQTRLAHHELGNHTWSHVDLGQLSERRARDELQRTHEVILETTGVAPKTMRPPYGRIAGPTLLAAADLGYPVVLWNVMMHEHHNTVAANAQQVIGGVVPGSIVLAHDGGKGPRWVGIHGLDRIIGTLKDRGYTFVTTSDLLTRLD
jgi:peptidoglycan/xylan/chitin deacetylase (PgdA/CDA1 family)